MTTATGFGSLPELVSEAAGRRARRRVFAAAGLPEAVAEDRSLRIPMAAMVQLFEAGGRATGDRLFGWRVGERMHPLDYGLWMRYALAAPTLELAIRRLSWSLPLHQTGSAVSLLRRRGQACLVYRLGAASGPDAMHHADHVVPSMRRVVAQYLGAAWRPDWVGLPYAADPDAAELAEAIGAPLRFGQAGVAMPLAPSALGLRRGCGAGIAAAPTQSDVLARLRARGGATSAVVEDLIRLSLLGGTVSRDGIAARTGMSCRSMQRALALEGTTFQDLLERVRRRKAADLLGMPGVPVTDVAAALGYADPSNFARAYRRWTGKAPSAGRARG